MPKVRLSDPVIGPGGEVTTLADLADRGLVTFTESGNFRRRGGRTGPAYFADATWTDGCWEISRTAFESRTGRAVTLSTRGDDQ